VCLCLCVSLSLSVSGELKAPSVLLLMQSQSLDKSKVLSEHSNMHVCVCVCERRDQARPAKSFFVLIHTGWRQFFKTLGPPALPWLYVCEMYLSGPISCLTSDSYHITFAMPLQYQSIICLDRKGILAANGVEHVRVSRGKGRRRKPRYHPMMM